MNSFLDSTSDDSSPDGAAHVESPEEPRHSFHKKEEILGIPLTPKASDPALLTPTKKSPPTAVGKADSAPESSIALTRAKTRELFGAIRGMTNVELTTFRFPSMGDECYKFGANIPFNFPCYFWLEKADILGLLGRNRETLTNLVLRGIPQHGMFDFASVGMCRHLKSISLEQTFEVDFFSAFLRAIPQQMPNLQALSMEVALTGEVTGGPPPRGPRRRRRPIALPGLQDLLTDCPELIELHLELLITNQMNIDISGFYEALITNASLSRFGFIYDQGVEGISPTLVARIIRENGTLQHLLTHITCQRKPDFSPIGDSLNHNQQL